MARIFTLQVVEADGQIVGYVMEDGAVLCLHCAAKCQGKDAFDYHFEQEHGAGNGGSTP